MADIKFPSKLYCWVNENGDIVAGVRPPDGRPCAQYAMNDVGVSSVTVTIEIKEEE